MKISNNYTRYTPACKARIENEQQIKNLLERLELAQRSSQFFKPQEEKIRWAKQVSELVNNKLEEIKQFANDNYSLRIGQLVEFPQVTMLTIKNKKADSFIMDDDVYISGPAGSTNVADPVFKEFLPTSEYYVLNGVLGVNNDKLESLKMWHNMLLGREIASIYGKSSAAIIESIQKYL